MKIQLIFPQGGSKLSSSGVLPPLGIVSLATYLRAANPSIDVELFDGEVVDQERIKDSLEGGVLGLSVTGANYHNALELAREAKKRYMRVLFGGPQATVKHRQILENQNSVDAVVRGDGEIAFNEFVRAVQNDNLDKLASIRSLSYRTADGKIIVNSSLKKCEQADLNRLPAPDYALLGDMLERYNENFQQHAYRKEGYTRFASIESQKGCAKTERTSEKKRRCSFCSRMDKGLRRLYPEEFWDRVQELHDPDGRTMIWDVSDSFSGPVSGDDTWLREVAKSKPSDLERKVNFKIFARADEMDEKTVRYLKQIGVTEVFMGVESGSQDRLDAENKGSTVGDNLVAVAELKKSGIKTYISLIYGMMGENAESLERTYNHVKELLEEGCIVGIGARLLFPLAGSRDYKLMLRKYREDGRDEFADSVRDSDYTDPEWLQKEWLENMTKTDIHEITQYHQKIIELAEGYGVTINDKKRLIIS